MTRLSSLMYSSLPLVLVVLLNNQRCGDAQELSCVTPFDNTGICVTISQCHALKDLVTKAKTDSSALELLKKHICRHLLPSVKVCCAEAVVEQRVSNPGSKVAVPATHSDQIRPHQTPGSSTLTREQRIKKLQILIPQSQCGRKKDIRRIFGGEDIKAGEWPWLASLGRIVRGIFVPLCGATVITIRHVLTAQHCFFKTDPPDVVRVGDHDLRRTDDMAAPQDFRIAKRVHGGFNHRTLENDIALITLDKDIRFDDYAQPICLPFREKLTDMFPGQNLIIAGWGKTETRQFTWVPKDAQIPTVSLQRCIKYYQDRGVQIPLSNKQICAGQGIQDTCSGDSGGPLMQLDLNDGKTYFVGIVSFGPVNCGASDQPGVYTRVGAWIPWILNNLI